MAEFDDRYNQAGILCAEVAVAAAPAGRDTAAALEGMRDTLRRLATVIAAYGGAIRERRDDVIVAEFDWASDAVAAALAFQAADAVHHEHAGGDVVPYLGAGVALGGTSGTGRKASGAALTAARRLARLAVSGEVVVDGAVREAVPARLPFEYRALGGPSPDGLDDPSRAYAVTANPRDVPLPDPRAVEVLAAGARRRTVLRIAAALIAAALIVAGGNLAWRHQPSGPVEPAFLASIRDDMADRTSVAVLPFENRTGDRDLEYVGDALTEILIDSLASIDGLLVIARDSTYTYKARTVAPRKVAADLGVRYVMEGSVQRAGRTLRISASLVDALDGRRLWSQDYDGPVEKLFDVQDGIVDKFLLTARAGPRDGDLSRGHYGDTQNIEALRQLTGLPRQALLTTWEGTVEARVAAEKAIELDPAYAAAWELLGETYLVEARRSRDAGKRSAALARAEGAARQALAANDRDPAAHTLEATVHWMRSEFDGALEEGRRAVDLGPSGAAEHAALTLFTFSAGDWAQTIEHARTAIRLHPHHPPWYLLRLSYALTLDGRFDAAIEVADAGLQRAESGRPREAFLVGLALAQAGRGDADEARLQMGKALELRPTLRAADFAASQAFADPAITERFRAALVEAGMPG